MIFIVNIFSTIVSNLEQLGIGMLLFLLAYISNMGLGAYKNVKLDGNTFDWKKIKQSGIKFVTLGISIAILSIVLSVIPNYITYIGITIAPETLSTLDGVIIISSFLGATINYLIDSVNKIKEIFK